MCSSDLINCVVSPPLRRRGLKSNLEEKTGYRIDVASPAEAWIEILILQILFCGFRVASPAEAWIEICVHPRTVNCPLPVASPAEAWIEIQDWTGRYDR